MTCFTGHVFFFFSYIMLLSFDLAALPASISYTSFILPPLFFCLFVCLFVCLFFFALFTSNSSRGLLIVCVHPSCCSTSSCIIILFWFIEGNLLYQYPNLLEVFCILSVYRSTINFNYLHVIVFSLIWLKMFFYITLFHSYSMNLFFSFYFILFCFILIIIIIIIIIINGNYKAQNLQSAQRTRKKKHKNYELGKA